jgi:hypothetical protein
VFHSFINLQWGIITAGGAAFFARWDRIALPIHAFHLRRLPLGQFPKTSDGPGLQIQLVGLTHLHGKPPPLAVGHLSAA